MTIGETIRNRRAALGLTQSELARRARTEARQIRRYEGDESQPSLTAAGLLARALGVTLDELVGAPRDPLVGTWRFELDDPDVQPLEVRISASAPASTSWSAPQS